jgi:hypothetical protein
LTASQRQTYEGNADKDIVEANPVPNDYSSIESRAHGNGCETQEYRAQGKVATGVSGYRIDQIR